MGGKENGQHHECRSKLDDNIGVNGPGFGKTCIHLACRGQVGNTKMQLCIASTMKGRFI